MMCAAGKVTIVEAPNVVARGELDPDQIHTPGVYVKRVVRGRSDRQSPYEIANFLELKTVWHPIGV